MRKRLPLILLILLIGTLTCLPFVTGSRPVTVQVAGRPPVIMEVLDPSLEVYSDLWRVEIGRRFTNAAGILVHGGNFVADQWIAVVSIQPWEHVTPIKDIVREMQARHPDRTLVLLACNTGHLKLGIPGVYYAHSSVWCMPDRSLKAEHFKARYAYDEMLKNLDGFEFRGLFDMPVDPRSRWEWQPDWVGNIFEFTCE